MGTAAVIKETASVNKYFDRMGLPYGILYAIWDDMSKEATS